MADISLKRHVENRIVAIDILRPFYLFFAAFYHLTSFAFYNHESVLHTMFEREPILGQFIWPAFQYSAICGQWLTAVTCFLIGWRQVPNRFYYKMFSILTFGTALAFFADDTYWKTGLLPWDLFGTLIIGLATAQAIYFFAGPRSAMPIFITSFLLLIAPLEVLTDKISLSPFFEVILFGNCSLGNLCYWPLFPWVFFVTASYSLGLLTQSYDLKKYRLSVILALILLVVFTGITSYPVQDARQMTLTNWGPYIFEGSRNRLLFWFFLHIIILLFLSLPNVTARVGKLGRWAGKLAINQYFWLAYLLQGTTSYLFAYYFRHTFAETPWIFTAVVLLHIPLTEVLTRVSTRLLFKKIERA